MQAFTVSCVRSFLPKTVSSPQKEREKEKREMRKSLRGAFISNAIVYIDMISKAS